jgi:hypothetical protein
VILVDATTYRRVRNQYDFEGPQTIHVKGKGEMVVYRLLGRKSQVAEVASAGGS